MYSIKGEKTEFQKRAMRILSGVTINTEPSSDESFTIVLFRIDPVDTYRYINAFRGLREREPMLIPKVRDDETTREAIKSLDFKERGFRSREDIPPEQGHYKTIYLGEERHDPPLGVLWVSGRKEANWEEWNKVEKDLKGKLEKLFEDFAGQDTYGKIPIYHEFWNFERQTIDSIRAAVRDLGPSPLIEQVAAEISRTLGTSIHHQLELAAQVRVGIYLFTGQSWILTGLPEHPKYLPGKVVATNRDEERTFDYLRRDEPNKDENAFDWVHRAGKAVLLSYPLSKTWETRIKKCKIEVPIKGGICIAPIKYDLEDTIVIGNLVISLENSSCFSPAHGFLAARVSQSIVGYLVRLFPIAGYPYWPDAKLSRGNAKIEICPNGYQTRNGTTLSATDAELMSRIEEIAKCLMPTESNVILNELSPGLTESVVFKLSSWDEGKIVEIPRVLKVGPADVIADELYRYYRYVHNKPVGEHSHVDIARCFPEMEWCYSEINDKDQPEKPNAERIKSATAAIVYTFVGLDAKQVPWSEWAEKARIEEIEEGIYLLLRQLSCWHGRGRQEIKPLGEMIISQAVLDKQRRRAERDTDQVIYKTVEWLEEIREKVERNGVISPSCIVHGDLHCDNAFAMTDSKSKIQSVAIIDWGKVQSGCHPLTDISILLADLAYRICYERPGFTSEWVLKLLKKYAFERGCNPRISELVFIVHLMRMIAWGRREKVREWFEPKAQTEAMEYIEEKMKELRESGALRT